MARASLATTYEHSSLGDPLYSATKGCQVVEKMRVAFGNMLDVENRNRMLTSQADDS
jgi:hypothetical protein